MKDKQIEQLIKAEKIRQTDGLELIPSENYVSSDVLKQILRGVSWTPLLRWTRKH